MSDQFLLEDLVVRVAGHVEHFCFWPQFRDLFGHLSSPYRGQYDVCEEELDVSFICPELLERLGSVFRRHHSIPVRLEELDRDPTDLEVVFHDQHGFGAPRERGILDGTHLGLGLVNDGEVDSHRGPHLELACHVDVTVHPLYDAIDRGEPEPGALAVLLRREEGIEHPSFDFVRDSGSRILDLQHGIRSRCHPRMCSQERRIRRRRRRPNRQLPSFRHGVTGIQGQVRQDLL